MDRIIKIIQDYIYYFTRNQLHKINFRKLSVTFLISISILFLLLTLFISFFSISDFEAILTRELQEERNPLFDFFMITVSLFGENYVAIPMIIGTSLLFYLFNYKLEAIFMLATSLGSVFNFGLKVLINRQRPTADLVEKITETSHQSFPSGHTVHYVVFFGMLLVLSLKIKANPVWAKIIIAMLCITLIIAVPFSRVYLGAHWTTDVIAGFFFGILVLSGLLFMYFKLQKRGFLQN
jgi:membrane-associated phospholipid phosphatase